jgi:ubiquitin C-terminal hydrolase
VCAGPKFSLAKVAHLTAKLSFLSIAEVFDNYMQQDAHEFLNYLLNTVADLLQGKFHYILYPVNVFSPC